MEWDQIADNWAAMTQRLRHGGKDGPCSSEQAKATGRPKGESDRIVPPKMMHGNAGNDRSLPSTL